MHLASKLASGKRGISQPSVIRRPFVGLAAGWAVKLHWLSKVTECFEITYNARWHRSLRIRTLHHNHVGHRIIPTSKGVT